jgi:hypothetical protein
MKCDTCLSKYRLEFLEKDNKHLQNNLNEITTNYYHKLVENLLLKDKIKYLEKEIEHLSL